MEADWQAAFPAVCQMVDLRLILDWRMSDDPRPPTTASIPRRTVLQMLAGSAMAGAIPAVASGHPIIRHLTDEGLFATRDREIGVASFVEHGTGKARFEGR